MEGKCDGDANDDGVFTEEELEWAWDCGWYLARWERGQGEVPTRCESLVSSAPVFPSAGCIEAYPGDFFNFNGSYFIPEAESDIYDDPACTILGDFVGIGFVYAPAPYDPNELCMIAFNLPTAFGPYGDNDIYTCGPSIS